MFCKKNDNCVTKYAVLATIGCMFVSTCIYAYKILIWQEVYVPCILSTHRKAISCMPCHDEVHQVSALTNELPCFIASQM